MKQEKVSRFLEEQGLTQATLSRSINVSSSAISQYLKDKYKGDVESLEVKLENFMKNYNPKTNDEEDNKIIVTANMQLSHFIMNELIATQNIGVVYGMAGCGKSTMIQAFIKEHPETIHIEAIPLMPTGTVITEIGRQLGVQQSSTLTQMIRDIAKALKQREAVLIVDEAENLNTSSLEAIRRIWDFSSVPTVLVGTPSLISNLKGRKGDLLQLFSRIALKVEFAEPTINEYETLFGEVATSIFKITKNMRIADNIYTAAKRFASMRNQTLNAGHIKAVLPMIMLDGGV